MWNMNCFVIPVITVATGNVTKRLIKYQEIIWGKHSVSCLQNTARLDKPHLRKVLPNYLQRFGPHSNR